MKEEWRVVEGYEGKYEVSNLGNVRRIEPNKPPRVRKPVVGMGGYCEVGLSNNRVQLCRVHRLVAKAFIPNPDKLPYVNHKDGNKQNNNVSNLEWVTAKQNQLHSRRVLKNYVHPVRCVETGKVYASMALAAEAIKTDLSHLWQAAVGRRRTAGGYHWQTVGESNAQTN